MRATGDEDGEGLPYCELLVGWTEISHAHGTRYRKAEVLGRGMKWDSISHKGWGSMTFLTAQYSFDFIGFLIVVLKLCISNYIFLGQVISAVSIHPLLRAAC